MARAPKANKQVETLTHVEAKRKNIPTAELQSAAQRAEEIAPFAPVVYPRRYPLAQGETSPRDAEFDPQLVWKGARVRLTPEQISKAAETGYIDISDAQLAWRGKDQQDWSDLVVNAPPLYIQDKIHPKAIIDDLTRRTKAKREAETDIADLFHAFNGIGPEAKTEFYQHDQNWSNRLILGDSLQVMASLAEREGLRGKVQCIYFDPPYGIKFNSNWQVSTRSRDVKDGKIEEISREPEQVRAFRDTWKDGIHSYLTYLRDRLTAMRDLLTESGSIFVQISDENIHRVRTILDEVFGESNFAGLIYFFKTTGKGSKFVDASGDYILWYAKDAASAKVRPIFAFRSASTIEEQYNMSAVDNASYRRLSKDELRNPQTIGSEWRRFMPSSIYSDSGGQTTRFEYSFEGRVFGALPGYFWRTPTSGMDRLAKASRLAVVGNYIRYRMYADDYPIVKITNYWDDVRAGGFGESKIYVVQTTTDVVKRCILMTTDPGDLVLDPTCGSGTTAIEELLSYGVPVDWLADVKTATEDTIFDLAEHLPREAGEALLDLATGAKPQIPAVTAPETVSPFEHPDAQRRFRVMEDVEELKRALDFLWDQWTVFLHPSQRQVVEQSFSGPARVSGSAGTGKTVVALHRAANILRQHPQAQLLLTTFSLPLANALEGKLRILIGEDRRIVPRVTVLPFKGVAHELFTLAFGHHPRAATEDQIRGALKTAAGEASLTSFTPRFLASEWLNVLDAWQLDSLDAYQAVPRLGRKNRLGAKQREKLWPVFVRAKQLIEAQGLLTWPSIFGRVTAYFGQRMDKPFSHTVIDEARDLGVPELRMLAAVTPNGPDTLFFAGDLGQRIFQEAFSWKALGVDIRGRSRTLKVNYRTSHQIRQAADRLLPKTVQDVDGNEQDRRGTVSVFNGPDPEVHIFADAEREIQGVADWIKQAIDDGIASAEIGLFVRSNDQLARARAAVKAADHTQLELSERLEQPQGRVAIGTMHLAKGLEYKAVAVMACDDDVLPLQERIETAADEQELDEVHDTERNLFYVACTRARDKLLVSGIRPGSEFIKDFSPPEKTEKPSIPSLRVDVLHVDTGYNNNQGSIRFNVWRHPALATENWS